MHGAERRNYTGLEAWRERPVSRVAATNANYVAAAAFNAAMRSRLSFGQSFCLL